MVKSCLMAKKNEEAYEKCFTELRRQRPQLKPEIVVTDYEKAAINGFEKVFQDVTIQGCFFHFSQCIFRSTQSHGLQKLYEENCEFALKMRMVAALAFVHPQSVVHYFDHLCDHVVFPLEAQPVLNYFEDTWIGRPDRRQVRRPPHFNIELWNCYESARIMGCKTNNICEAWHRSFNMFIVNHPIMWKFIKTLKMEQAETSVVREQNISGQGRTPP